MDSTKLIPQYFRFEDVEHDIGLDTCKGCDEETVKLCDLCLNGRLHFALENANDYTGNQFAVVICDGCWEKYDDE